MHEGEVRIDAALVERLVADQLPHLADRPIRTIPATGTMNAIYRLGDDLCVRLPRLKDSADRGERELHWLPRLARHLTLPIPEPVATGAPGAGYPFRWAVYRWIDGTTRADHPTGDETQLAADLAAFVLELRAIDTTAAPRAGRRPLAQLDAATRAAIAASGDEIERHEATAAPPAGRRPLAQLDGATRAAIAASGDEIDRHAVTAAWDRALTAPAWDGERAWIHNDLLPTNLLVEPSTGRLSAVIDFGGAGAGDPAGDVVPAWSVFGPTGRDPYRAALGVDDGTWARARGYALHQAALIIPYYAGTNPGLVSVALRTIGQVLGDATR